MQNKEKCNPLANTTCNCVYLLTSACFTQLQLVDST